MKKPDSFIIIKGRRSLKISINSNKACVGNFSEKPSNFDYAFKSFHQMVVDRIFLLHPLNPYLYLLLHYSNHNWLIKQLDVEEEMKEVNR